MRLVYRHLTDFALTVNSIRINFVLELAILLESANLCQCMRSFFGAVVCYLAGEL